MDSAQEGAYIRLLAYDWTNNGIPEDKEASRKLSRLPDGSAIEPVLACFQKHPRKEGFLTHSRLQHERRKQSEHRKERKESGLKGAKKRWHSYRSAIQQPMAKNGSSSSSSSSIGTYTADCRVALFYLNEKSGNLFREARGNFELITARLKEPGVTIEGVKLMIDAKCREWKGTEWEKFLRPSTLFGRSKFDDYYGQRNKPAVPVNGHATKKPLPHGMTREQAMAAFSSGEIDEEPT